MKVLPLETRRPLPDSIDAVARSEWRYLLANAGCCTTANVRCAMRCLLLYDRASPVRDSMPAVARPRISGA
jgi:hypothetical protein